MARYICKRAQVGEGGTEEVILYDGVMISEREFEPRNPFRAASHYLLNIMMPLDELRHVPVVMTEKCFNLITTKITKCNPLYKQLLRRSYTNILRPNFNYLSTSRGDVHFIPGFLLPTLPAELRPSQSRDQVIPQRIRRLKCSTLSQPCRTFSASTSKQTAVVTANPRKDEMGNDMLIDITARAANVGLKLFRRHSLPLTKCASVSRR